MNNEETMIMMPEKSGATEQNNVNKADEAKNKKKGNSSQRVAAAVAGAAMGGVATAATAGMMNADEVEAQVEEDAQPTEAAASAPAAAPVTEEKEEEVAVSVDENGDPDYTGHAGANPVVQDTEEAPVSQPIPASNPSTNDDAPEVQVLGIYQSEDGQELAYLTDGETVAAVLDANGDGEANVIAVDENMNGEFEEGEIHDVSDQHISMQSIEQEYVAQHPEEFGQQEYYAQQQEMEQQDTFAYNASDDYDYNNNAELFYDA